jgi:diguanylate cyclase (GGDEF)-like protein
VTGQTLPAWLLSPLFLLVPILLGGVILAQRRLIRRLADEARRDPLTGLPNRRGLALAWDALPQPRALILVDLVGFKAINDSHGHIVGDRLLKQVAQRLAATVPEPGLLARWGGDEFAAAVPAGCADKVRSAIAEASALPYVLLTGVHPVLTTIGARTGLGDGREDLEAAVEAAADSLQTVRAA